MKYKIQVQVDTLRDAGIYKYKAKEWRDLQHSDGHVYQYETEQEAQDVRAMCYPDHMDQTRVICA